MKSRNMQEDILKGIAENKKLLLEILEQINKPSLSYDVNLNSYTQPSSFDGSLHCDIERCKKTDAKHYEVRLPDGNGNLELVGKNYCSVHFNEAVTKGVEFLL